MSSIMRARSGLTGRGEVSEVIGLFSRAEGCWTFDARDQMPRPSRAIAHYPVDNPPTAMRSRSRASGFVHRPKAVFSASRPLERCQTSDSDLSRNPDELRGIDRFRKSTLFGVFGLVLAVITQSAPVTPATLRHREADNAKALSSRVVY